MLSQVASSGSRSEREVRLGVEAAFVRPSPSEYTVSLLVSLALNLFFCWAFFSGSASQPPPEDPLIDDVQWVALTALGEPPKPNAVPRIVAPPPPPPPESKEVSIGREIKKEKPKKKKPKKEKPKKEKPKPKKRPKEKAKKKRKKPKKRREVTLNSLFGATDDPRADRGPRKGDRRGHSEGTSSKFEDARELSIYVSRVSTFINRRFEVPSTISERQLKKLKAEIYVRIGSNRKIKGKPRWVKKSGNRFFDEAAMRAVMVFSSDQDGKLPLPKDKELRRYVFKKGFSLVISQSN